MSADFEALVISNIVILPETITINQPAFMSGRVSHVSVSNNIILSNTPVAGVDVDLVLGETQVGSTKSIIGGVFTLEFIPTNVGQTTYVLFANDPVSSYDASIPVIVVATLCLHGSSQIALPNGRSKAIRDIQNG